MSELLLIERIIDLFCGAGCMALFILSYGEYKTNRKIAALIYWVLSFSFSISYWYINLTTQNEVLRTILMIIGLVFLDALYVILAKGKWYMNVIIIEIFFALDGIGVMFVNLLFEKVFHVAYEEIMLYESLSQVLTYEAFTVSLHVLVDVIIILVMRKIFVYEHMHNETVGSKVYWIVQLIASYIVQSNYLSRGDHIDMSFITEFCTIILSVFIVIAVSYAVIRRIVLRIQTQYIVQILEVQKEFYQDIYTTYEEMRNLRHDLMNHLRQIELLQEQNKDVAEQYSDEMKGKIEELDRYRNTTFIQLILEKLNQKKEYASVDLSYTGLEDESILQDKLSQNDILSIVRCMGEIGFLHTVVRDGKEMRYCIEEQKGKYRFVVVYPAVKKIRKLTKEQKCAMKDAKKVLRYVANKENMTINIFKEKKEYKVIVTV